MPYDTTLGAMIHDPGFRNLLPKAVFQKARIIQRASWTKRVLLLADRVSLVNQAADAFKKRLPEIVNPNKYCFTRRQHRVRVVAGKNIWRHHQNS